MWPTWTLLRTSLTGFSLPLTRMVEGQLTLRKSGAVLTPLFDFRVGIHFIFFQGVRISCILLVSQFLLSFSSFTFGKRGSLELDLNGINIHQTQFFFFLSIPLKANAASCKTVKFSPAPDTKGNRAIQICRPLAWPDLNKSPKKLPRIKVNPSSGILLLGCSDLPALKKTRTWFLPAFQTSGHKYEELIIVILFAQTTWNLTNFLNNTTPIPTPKGKISPLK